MKKRILNATISLVLLSSLAVAQDGDQARDLYLAHARNRTKGRPGSKVRIELLRAGVKTFVPVNSNFQAGDKVKLHFEVNFEAYVTAVNLGTSGKLALLFPYEGETGRVSVKQNYVIPHRPDLWFEFDRQPGVEDITIILSSKPLATDQAAGKSKVSQEEWLKELKDRVLTESRDLNLVQVSSGEGYTLCDEPPVRRPVKFSVKLRHN